MTAGSGSRGAAALDAIPSRMRSSGGASARARGPGSISDFAFTAPAARVQELRNPWFATGPCARSALDEFAFAGSQLRIWTTAADRRSSARSLRRFEQRLRFLRAAKPFTPVTLACFLVASPIDAIETLNRILPKYLDKPCCNAHRTWFGGRHVQL
jgi:hypothetical protein